MLDMVSFGIALIDFTPLGMSPNGFPLYESNPGGSSANFAVAAARMGSRCAFLGKVGDDVFGRLLRQTFLENDVDVRGLMVSQRRSTTGAFVTLDENGEREFLFYRNYTADSEFTFDDIPLELIDETRVLHITSFILANRELRKEVLRVLDYASAAGKIITFDVNWRPFSWTDPEVGFHLMEQIFTYTNILKVSVEEMETFTGFAPEEWERGAAALLEKGPAIVIVTFGEGGSAYATKTHSAYIPGYPTRAVDTTGAGDCCFGVFMHCFLKEGLSPAHADPAAMGRALDYANLAAAYSVGRRGGIPSFPSLDEVQRLIAASGKGGV